jgi:glyceraldehyde-3-phosphate dehydrogenase/erythrose-4-phosphate dehydrogenase
MPSHLEVLAVNDIGDPRTCAHLLKHDTAMGHVRPIGRGEAHTMVLVVVVPL